MKRLSIAILSLLFVFSLFISCNNETPVPTLGSINGRVVYSYSNNNINVSLEKSNGVSIESRFFRSTKANNDGSYSFSDLEAGTYTVYASTDDSVQRAVCTNVNVEAGRGVTASDLVLTPIGSIKGKILIDGKKSGNIGCTVFIEGTSYKAVTADDGSFEITGIPSGKEYKLFVMKGETISLVASSVKVPDASAANIDSITIDSSMLSHGIIWKGSLPNHPDNPVLYWAYYNTADGNSYIYNGSSWDILAKAGAAGEKGETGTSISWLGSYAGHPSSTTLYAAYYNTTDGNSYIYDGSSWTILASKGGQGDKGETGDKGEQGETGATGATGPAGLDGKPIVWKGSLESAPAGAEELWAYYNTGDGNSYIYNGSSWDILAKAGAAGEKGETGTSISWLGSYAGHPSSTTLYAAYYNTTDGNSYIYDGSSWTILASKGGQGDKGETGDKGEQGETGATGATGPAGLDGKPIVWKGSLESAPAGAEELWAYYNTGDGNSYIFNGTTWDILAKAGSTGPKGDKGDAGTSISWLGSFAGHPSSTTLYAAYYNTTDGNSYIYDGSSWTILASKGGQGEQGANGLDGRSMVWKGSLASAPTAAEELWAYYNTTDGNAYIYSDSSWNLLIENVSINYDEPTIIGTIAQSEYYDLSSVYIKVVDNTNDSTVWNNKPASDGDFAISGLDSSRRYTLYFSSEKLSNVNISYRTRALALDNTSTTYGAVMIDIRPLPGKAQDVGEVTLTPNGTVMGTVTLKGEEDSSDIDVYLYGTSFATKTDTGGKYVISDVPQGTYKAVFSKDGYITEEKNVIVFNSNPTVKPVSTISSFSLLNYYGSISGQVTVNDSGNGSGVEVKAVNKDGEHIYTVFTDSEGKYNIPSAYYGEYTISFSKKGYATFIKDGLIVAKSSAFALSPELSSIYGGLKITTGYSDKVDSSGIILNVYKDGALVCSTTTTSTGVVMIDNLNVGTEYKITALAEGYESVEETKVSVESGKVCTVSLAKLSNKYGSVSGSVYDSYGEPVAGATVMLKSEKGVSYTLITELDGVFFKNDILTDEYEVTVTKTDFSTKVLPSKYVVEAASTTNIPAITLTSIYGTINGSVSFADGRTPENIVISIEDESGIAVNTANTSSSGTFSFSMLSGTYLVRANAFGFDEVSQTVSVQAGNSYSITLDPLPSIYGSLKVSAGYNNKENPEGITVTVEKDGKFVRNSSLTSSGSVIFTDLACGSGYTVSATATGYSSSSVSNVTVNKNEETTIALDDLSYSYGSVSGSIQDANGNGLPGALILLSSVSNTYTISSDIDGSFRKNDIATGTYNASVSLQDYISVTIGEQINVSSAAETKLGNTKLTKINGTIEGSVGFNGKSDASGINVSLANESGKIVDSLVTTNTGAFIFRNVPAGEYILSATIEGYSVSSKNVTVSDGGEYQIVLDSLLSEYGSITGTVLDPSDNPIVGAIVLTTDENGTSETTTTDSAGNLAKRLKNGTYSITISKTGYVSQFFNNVVISPETVYPLGSITMTIGTAGVSGRVVLTGETNHSGATVTITNTLDDKIIYSTTTDDSGAYYFSGITVGEYSLKVQKTDFVTDQSVTLSPSAGIVVQAPVITLKTNNSTVTGNIVLEGTSNCAGVNVLLSAADNSVSYNTATLQSGKFTLTEVKPGNYSMTITKPGYESQVVNGIFVESSSTKTVDTINLSIAFASINGKVQLELKSDHAGAQVTATNVGNTNIIYSAITNSAGEYSFAEMYSGEYSLVITADNYVTVTLPTINVIDSNTADAGTISLSIARGTISGLAKLEGYTDHSGITVSLLGTDYTTTTASDGSYSFHVPSGNYPGGIRYEHEDYETASHASTIPVLTNSTYAVPDKTLRGVNVPYVSGKVSIYGVTDGHYENIDVRIAELPAFSYTTTSDGTWFFEHVPVGTYTLEIERENARKVTKIVDLKASPSITVEDIELIPDSVTLTGNISLGSVEDYSGVTVRVTTPGSVELKTVTNAAGYFYISNIVASKSHTIYFEKEGWNTQSFEIEAYKYEPLSMVNYTDEQTVSLTDTTAPVLTGMTATIGRSTEAGREVSLYLYGSEKGSGIKYIQGNTAETFEDVARQDYYNPFTLIVPDELGAKTIYVQVTDAAGNVSNTVSANIVITNDKAELYGPLSGDKLHLTKENSPYLMVNNVMVEKGNTLIIDPGVEIQINGDYYIYVEGKLEAIGTESDRIKIYGIDDGANNWYGIKFLADEPNRLSYIDISGLKNGITGYCNIDHALIRANGWAVGITSDDPEDCLRGSLTNSTVKGSVSVAYYDVKENTIDGNTVYLYYIPFVVDNNISGSTTIQNSNIDGNTFSGSKLDTRYSFVYNNEVSSTTVYSYSDIQKYMTYNGCTLHLGYYDHLDSGMLPSAIYNIQFNNCSFPRFAADIRDSNFMNCGPITVESDRSTQEKYICTGNYWGDINTVEIKSKGEGQNLSFITDYYDDFNKSIIEYGEYKESAIDNAGYQGDGFGRSGGSAVYNIGDKGPAGGYIFFDKGYYSDGWRYLEAAPSDIGKYVFGYYRPDGTNDNVVGTAEVIGAGRYNSERLVEHMDIGGNAYSNYSGGATYSEYAAKKCLDYSYGEYDDWFLPSKDELCEMYKALKCPGGTNHGGWCPDKTHAATSTEETRNSFANAHYDHCDHWSSSESSSDRACVQQFYDGNQSSYCYRFGNEYVRAVRAF